MCKANEICIPERLAQTLEIADVMSTVQIKMFRLQKYALDIVFTVSLNR